MMGSQESNHMEQIITISLVSATGLMGAGVGLGWVRREVTKKPNDYRIGQALRRGLANPDGIRIRTLPMVQWQTCESTSARWS
jgi:hypothetical protein